MSFLPDKDIQRLLENSDAESIISDLENDYVGNEDDGNEETIENIQDFINVSGAEVEVQDHVQDNEEEVERHAPVLEDQEEDVVMGELPTRNRPISRRRATRQRAAAPQTDNWNFEVRELQRVFFTGHLIQTKQSEIFEASTSIFSIFRSIINDVVIKLMVEQTNIYGQRLKYKATLPHSRIKRWCDVDEQEMLKFIGVLLLTGLISFPTIESYWKKDVLYQHTLLHHIDMSYNRFNLLLRCWHFADNQVTDITADRIYKIRPLLDLVMRNERNIYTPGEVLVVDESMVHFRGRLHFRQYIPSKTHKYGVKIYKLCTAEGYTLGYQIYHGESRQCHGLDTSGSIVIQLAEEFLDQGRLIVTDNYYTSIPLAEFLKSRNTDLLGTVNKKRRGLPKDVIQASLKVGEIAVQQKNNITLLKWHDKRDVTMLSTCHGKDMALSSGRNPRLKPRMVLDYNTGKKGIDVADQLASYNSPIRKTVIWYKKVAADLLSISIVNSLIIYNEFHPLKKEKLSILSAYEQIIKSLLVVSETVLMPSSSGPSHFSGSLQRALGSSPTVSGQSGPSRPSGALGSDQHFLIDLPKISGKRSNRKRCTGCYKRLLDEGNSTAVARKRAKKVYQQCKQCKKGFCFMCFEIYHK
ncbi:piggyBac transposable element-derived protein 4-like [Vanessa atalanta]|uniref:piggyBac transposable element-derived protein 4-like n=1 Tax=Vanessa atalanta TaxID=42275 RepID=UPI001FCD567D|nr:piggyBac transposable element-derived protein 4-like [Vanessa atalanta]